MGAVTAVNLRTGRAGAAINVGWEPVSLAITSDGRTLYAAVDGLHGEDGPESPERVVVIDTATSRVRQSITWQVPPMFLAMAPADGTVWVASTIGDRASTADNTVTPISVADGRRGGSLRTSGWLNDVDDSPRGLAISPDGRTLYVAVGSGLETFRVR